MAMRAQQLSLTAHPCLPPLTAHHSLPPSPLTLSFLTPSSLPPPFLTSSSLSHSILPFSLHPPFRGLYPPPRNPYGLQWTPVDSSGPFVRPDWLVQCPVHWTLTGLQATFQSPVPVQWTESPVRVHWSPLESTGLDINTLSGVTSVLIVINYNKKAKIVYILNRIKSLTIL